MGFTVTPRAYHPWGTANHLVQFGRSFIEIVGIHDESKLIEHTPESFSFSAHAKACLAEREGMGMLVLSSTDAQGDTAGWADTGLRTYEPVYFERQATLPDGEQVKVAFTVSFVTHEELPACAFFVCQQHYPQYFWKPDYQVHANGATEIGSATLSVSGDPGRFAEFAERLTGLPSEAVPGGISTPLTWGRLDLLTPEAARDAYPALTGAAAAPADHFVHLGIELPDAGIDAAARLLDEAAIPYTRGQDYLDVAPSEVFGLALRLGRV